MPGKKWFFVFAVLLISLCTAAAVYASTAALIERSVMAGGGGSYTVGNLELAGTTGQAVVGIGESGSIRLSSGFWGGGETTPRLRLYLPLVTFEE